MKAASSQQHQNPHAVKQFADVSKEVKSNSAAGRRKMLREGGSSHSPPPTAKTVDTNDGFNADFAAFPSSTSQSTSAPQTTTTAVDDPFFSKPLPDMGKEFDDGFSSSNFDAFSSNSQVPPSSSSTLASSSSDFGSSDPFGSDPFANPPAQQTTVPVDDPFSLPAASVNNDPFSVSSAPTTTTNNSSTDDDPFAPKDFSSTSNTPGDASSPTRFSAFNSGRGVTDFNNSTTGSSSSSSGNTDILTDLAGLDINNSNQQQQHKHSLKQTVDIMSAFGNMGHHHQTKQPTNMMSPPQQQQNFGMMSQPPQQQQNFGMMSPPQNNMVGSQNFGGSSNQSFNMQQPKSKDPFDFS
jgi:hypothetical protein